MTTRNVSLQNSGMVDTCLLPACQSPGYWQRRDAASQRMLARVMRENRARDECLGLAVETLELYTEGSTDGVPAQGTLVEIETCLAQLEPEEETG